MQANSTTETKLVAVVGAIGSGKTRFIDLASGVRPSFMSKMTMSYVIPRQFDAQGTSMTLLDTPGFNGGVGSLRKTLDTVSSEIGSRYGPDRKLDGIIWLHRMSDYSNNIFPSPEHLPTIKSLLGTPSLDKLTVVTNMWGGAKRIQEPREHTLRVNREMFRTAIDQGARFLRHDNTHPSSQTIMQPYIDAPLQPQPERPRPYVARRGSVSSVASGRSDGSSKVEGGTLLQNLKNQWEKSLRELSAEREKTEELMKQLASEKDSSEKLQGLLLQAEATHSTALQEIREELSEAAIARSHLQREVQDLRLQMEAEGEASRMIRSKLEMEIHHIKSQLEAERESASQARAELEQEVRDLKTALSMEREASAAERSDFKAEVEMLRVKLEEEKEAASSEISRFEQDVATLRAKQDDERQTASTEIERLEQEVSSLTTRLDEERESAQQDRTQLEQQLENQQAVLAEERQSISEERQKFELETSNFNHTIADLRRQIDELSAAVKVEREKPKRDEVVIGVRSDSPTPMDHADVSDKISSVSSDKTVVGRTVSDEEKAEVVNRSKKAAARSLSWGDYWSVAIGSALWAGRR
ncbi:hypothetical protein C8Q75DRAFT_408597 [Abortiporus biennis]|nr:hypothetical protein C8Q75DRAFT_408597 [Abortiporus biennis]